MPFPTPSEKQGRLLWMAVTALAIAILIAFLGLFLWMFAWVFQRLSAVILPLAIAGILAYVLEPLVGLFERRRIPRQRAILLVYSLGIALFLLGAGTVIPALVSETEDLVHKAPTYAKDAWPRLEKWLMESKFQKWLANSHLQSKDHTVWTTQVTESIQGWTEKLVPIISNWVLAQLTKLVSWVSFLIGLALVPVYLFYFLLEKHGIERGWSEYLPVQESKWKLELVFIIQSINDYLILFFRGQVLVALCDGILLTAGFFIIGLNYALLLGLVAGVLSIVPFLGVILSLFPALLLAALQFGDWLHPALVLGLFLLAQTVEGFYLTPKIMGDRVGLHPLTIMIAVMVGTTLMGGIVGGVLAIPLTAALRVLMFRYVWTPAIGSTAQA
jgi:predicted PurR-regulated permease PerM